MEIFEKKLKQFHYFRYLETEIALIELLCDGLAQQFARFSRTNMKSTKRQIVQEQQLQMAVKRIDFFKQQMLFINSASSPFYNNTFAMLGDSEDNQLYATFQAYLSLNHLCLLYNPNRTQPSNLWSIPLFYSCRNIQIFLPQEPSCLPTTHEMPPAIEPDRYQYPHKCLRKRAHRQRKKRMRDSKKEIESAKKNSEPNIVNHFFSFFGSYQKSERVVQKSIYLLNRNIEQIDRIKNLFYNIVRAVNFKRARRYVNKKNILNLCTSDRLISEIPNISEKLQEIGLISIEEFCYLFRVVAAEFIRNVSITAILTSKRITGLAKCEHLRRRRKILGSMLKQAQ